MTLPKIKVKDLIKYPFKIQEEPVKPYALEYIFSALNVDSYNIDDDKFDSSLFQIKVIYDNPHDSDESSYRYLLFYKEKFACLFGYTGDRGTDTVLFASMKLKLALRDYFLSLQPEYEDSSDIIDEEIDLSDSYTIFLEQKGEFYYHIKSPMWSYCFQKDIPLYYIEEDNSLTPVTFIDFMLKGKDRNDYTKKFEKENHFMYVKMNEATACVPFHRIVFKAEKN